MSDEQAEWKAALDRPRAEKGGAWYSLPIFEMSGEPIRPCIAQGYNIEQCKERADRIVRAVNNYESLLSACKAVAESLRGCDLVVNRGSKQGQSQRAASYELSLLAVAIAKAEGQP